MSFINLTTSMSILISSLNVLMSAAVLCVDEAFAHLESLEPTVIIVTSVTLQVHGGQRGPLPSRAGGEKKRSVQSRRFRWAA